MNPNKEHIVPFSRKKIMSVIRTNLFFLLFCVGGLVLFTIRPTERTAIFRLLAVPLILLFGFALISAYRKLNTESPGLIVSSRGIIEYSSFSPVGLIAWRDIVDMYTQQSRSARWLMIEVRNPEQYLSRRNFLLHIFQRLHSILGGSAIFISTGLIDIEFDEMVAIIKEYYDKHGSA